LFDDFNDSVISDEDRPLFIGFTPPVNQCVKSLRYLSCTIEEMEVRQLTKIFPNIEMISFEAENVFHHNYDFKLSKNLKDLSFRWLSSDEYADIDSQESNEDYQFKIDLTVE
jgi:hypothetical protein